MSNITIGELNAMLKWVKTLKTIGEYKEYARFIRDKYELTDVEVLDLLNKRIFH